MRPSACESYTPTGDSRFPRGGRRWSMEFGSTEGGWVYPFLDGTLFGASGFVEPGALRHAASRDLARVFTSWEGFKSFLLHPVVYSFPEPLSYKDNVLSLGYLLLLPLLFLTKLEISIWRLAAFAAALSSLRKQLTALNGSCVSDTPRPSWSRWNISASFRNCAR